MLNMARDDHLQLFHQLLHVVAHILSKSRCNRRRRSHWRNVADHVSAVEETLDPAAEVGLPSFLRDEPHRFAKAVLGDDVCCVAVEGVFQVKGTFVVEHLVAGPLGVFMDFFLELEHLAA